VSGTAASAGTEWRRHWPLVAAAASAFSLGSLSTSSFGVMLLPIERDLGWSRTEIASGPVLISLMTISLGMLMGVAVDRLGPRIVGLLALTGLCAVLALMSQVKDQLWQWWLLWAGIGIASSAIPPSMVTAVSRTFTNGRGLAIAVVLSGSGISSLVVPSLANALVEEHGWRLAYVWLAGMWGVIVIPLAALFLRPACGSQPATPEAAASPHELPGLTVREGFRAPVFYKLLLGTFASTFAGTALVLNLVPVLHSTGLAAASAAAVAGSIGIATITGRIIGGGLIDRFSAGMIAAAVSAISIVLPASLLLQPGSVPASVTGVFIYGMMGGALTPAIAYLASRHLGQRSFGTLYATINAVLSIGVGGGPLLANFIYDRTNSYEPVLWGTIPLFALGALLYASLGRYPDFAKRETTV
jgi:predicted MFS family arabinose efflux permease